MTNLEMIAKQMTRYEQAPVFALVCRYWMETRDCGCKDCPCRYRCDRDPLPSDQEMEEWLLKEVTL